MKASSPPPIVLSDGICPSGWIPCSRQKSSQQALPTWIPPWPTWMEITYLILLWLKIKYKLPKSFFLFTIQKEFDSLQGVFLLFLFLYTFIQNHGRLGKPQSIQISPAIITLNHHLLIAEQWSVPMHLFVCMSLINDIFVSC